VIDGILLAGDPRASRTADEFSTDAGDGDISSGGIRRIEGCLR